ncbi:MAG: GIY-YIG nuclease family protein [Pseudomonadota bacterium]
MEMQPCVYILASGRCRDLYTGVTSDLMKRLYQHRSGITKGWAAKKSALHLVWFEQHGDMESAITREKRIKNWNRDWKLNLIEAANPEWLDLAIGLGFEPLQNSARIDPRLRGDDGV